MPADPAQPVAPPPLCPECGTPVSTQTPLPAHWSHRRILIPRLIVLAVVAAALAALLRPSPGLSSGGAMPRGVAPISLPRPLATADLAAPAPPAPGDAVLRDVLRAIGTMDRYWGVGELQVRLGSAEDTATRTMLRTRGWPIPTVSHLTWETTSGDGAGGAILPISGPWLLHETRPFSFRYQRGTNPNETFRIDLSVFIVALVAADGLRRLTRARLRRRSPRTRRWIPLAAAAAPLALAAALALIPSTSHSSINVSAPAPTWIPAGLTTTDLRALGGRPDADAILASSLAAALGPSADGAVHLGVLCSMPADHEMTWYGSPVPLWYTASLTRYPAADAPQLPATPLLLRPGDITFIELPARPGTAKVRGVGMEHGRIACLLLVVYVTAVIVPLTARIAARVIARRRVARGRCVTCAYPLARSA